MVVTKGDKGELVKAWANPVDSEEPLVAEAYAIYRALTVSLWGKISEYHGRGRFEGKFCCRNMFHELIH